MKTRGITLILLFIFFITGVSAQETKSKKDANGVYTTVQVMPEFPGGMNALTDFLMKNITYPDEAKKAGITGKVYVQFIVTENGRVTDVKVIRSANPLLDAEAVRVVEAMPSWTPGKENGEAVKVFFTLPITFSLK